MIYKRGLEPLNAKKTLIEFSTFFPDKQVDKIAAGGGGVGGGVIFFFTATGKNIRCF